MLLPNPLSNTKKLFQRTIQCVKSLFSGGTYQRLPKTPPSKPFSCIENYFSQSCNRDHQSDIFVKIDVKPAAVKKRIGTNNILSSTPQSEKRDDDQKEKKRIVYQGITRDKEISETCCKGDIITREARRCLVAKKLKELENMELMMRDIVENVLDIEEVLHYYSSLTCPVYIDIFDKFFMGVYCDLFNLKAERSSWSAESCITQLANT